LGRELTLLYCGERAAASFLAAVLTEIYLCASCSCHGMLRSATAPGSGPWCNDEDGACTPG
jgi:hypothetical protein